MKKLQITSLFLFLLLVGSGAAMAQDQELVKVIQQFNQQFTNSTNVHLKTEYRLYKTWHTSTPESIQKGEYQRQGDLFHSRIGQNESLQTEQGRIEIDHRNQMVYYINQSNELLPSPAQIDLEEVLKIVSKVEKSEAVGNTQTFRLFFPQGFEMARLDVKINPSSGLLKSLVIYYGQAQQFGNDSYNAEGSKPRLEVNYQPASSNSAPKQIDSAKILRFVDEEPQLQPAYKEYQLIRMG